MPKISDKHVQMLQNHLGDLRISLIKQIDKSILLIQEEIIEDIEKDN